MIFSRGPDSCPFMFGVVTGRSAAAGWSGAVAPKPASWFASARLGRRRRTSSAPASATAAAAVRPMPRATVNACPAVAHSPRVRDQGQLPPTGGRHKLLGVGSGGASSRRVTARRTRAHRKGGVVVGAPPGKQRALLALSGGHRPPRRCPPAARLPTEPELRRLSTDSVGNPVRFREATSTTRRYRARRRIAHALTGMDRPAAASRRPMK
jgi:hypothetical protein